MLSSQLCCTGWTKLQQLLANPTSPGRSSTTPNFTSHDVSRDETSWTRLAKEELKVFYLTSETAAHIIIIIITLPITMRRKSITHRKLFLLSVNIIVFNITIILLEAAFHEVSNMGGLRQARRRLRRMIIFLCCDDDGYAFCILSMVHNNNKAS